MGISFGEWVAEFRAAARHSDSLADPLRHAGKDALNGIWQTVTSRYPIGTNVYDRQWDALVVLDACRTDALRAVVGEYPQLRSRVVDAITSVGTGTVAWTAKTFTDTYRDQIAETAYLSANVYTRSVLSEDMRPPSDPAPICFPRWRTVDANAFDYVEYAFESGWSDRLNVTPPKYVTDRAVDIGRTRQPDRLIVHYTQPHIPYIGAAMTEGREPSPFERDPWPHILRGSRTWDDAKERYLDNLRTVLDSVMTFTTNFEGTVVITADHGELFGEFGAYAHPEGFPHPNLIRVPWLEMYATDTATYTPSAEEREPVDIDTSAQLAALGYK